MISNCRPISGLRFASAPIRCYEGVIAKSWGDLEGLGSGGLMVFSPDPAIRCGDWSGLRFSSRPKPDA